MFWVTRLLASHRGQIYLRAADLGQEPRIQDPSQVLKPSQARCPALPYCPEAYILVQKDYLRNATDPVRTVLPHPTPGRIRRYHFAYYRPTCTATLGSPSMLAMATSLQIPETDALAEASMVGRWKYFVVENLILAVLKRSHQGKEACWLCCLS